MKFVFALIAGLSLTAPLAAAPLDAASQSDVRCVAALALAANSAEGEQLTGLAFETFYYIGRLDGRVPGLDLEAALRQEAIRITDASQKQLLDSCTAQYLKRAQDIQSIGKSMQGH
jgi:hypothetical protein